MEGIRLFSEDNCEGQCKVVTKDMEDLAEINFLKHAKSLIVVGNPWVAYCDKKYKGKFWMYTVGSHSSLAKFSEQISSLRQVKDGLKYPEITVYEHINYGGKAKPVKEEIPSLRAAGMENMVSSHKCKRGAWLLSQQENYQGTAMVTLAGDEVANYAPLGWNDKLASLKPLKGE